MGTDQMSADSRNTGAGTGASKQVSGPAGMETYQMFIDGRFADSETGEIKPTCNPATEEPIAHVPVGTRNDAKRAIEAARQLRTGTVWINDYHLLSPLAPFGGYKQSGVGRELGPHGLLEFTQIKHIHVDLTNNRAKKFWYEYVFND